MKYEIGGLEVKVVRNAYTGLWDIRYVDGGMVWSGPYKTKKEGMERLKRHLDLE